ncbi:MAG: helix-turn-helix domain-containing protein [Cyanophyceae cyanobacterium]
MTSQLFTRFGDAHCKLLLSSERRWHSLCLWHLVYPATGELLVPSLPHLSITIALSTPCNVQQSLQGTLRQGRFLPGDVILVGSGKPSQWQWQGEDTFEVLHLCLSTKVIDKVITKSTETDLNQVKIVDRFMIQDVFIRQIGLLVKQELETGGIAGYLYVDALAYSLAVHLLREHSTLTRKTASAKKLSQNQLDLVFGHIEDNIHQKLSLEQLANSLRLKPDHLSQLFKESTGLTPYQYVVERRLDRAKRLLKETNLPISEVVNRSGFSSHSGLIKAFHLHLGMTPKMYRAHGEKFRSSNQKTTSKKA